MRLLRGLLAAGCLVTITGAPARVTDGTRRPAARVPAPEPLRGLYVSRWAARGQAMHQLIELAQHTEINALVIDVKDDRGLVLYKSGVALAHEIGADTLQPLTAARIRGILDSMHAHSIYPIARIVVVKDPLLADRKREWAIIRKSDHTPWLDKNGNPWLDPHHPEIWNYAADLAAEAVALGFSEVQFDYVRFPDEKTMLRETVFPLAQKRSRQQVIRDQLGILKARLSALGAPMAIDVFGLTASDTTDMGIGQQWEMFDDRADVVEPMDYPSHFALGTYGLDNPNAHPYATVDHALADARLRSLGVAGAAKIRPWYQDFTLGPPHYGAEQVRAQIQAGYDNGIRGWLLWNPGSRYTVAALRDSIRPEAEEAPHRKPDPVLQKKDTIAPAVPRPPR